MYSTRNFIEYLMAKQYHANYILQMRSLILYVLSFKQKSQFIEQIHFCYYLLNIIIRNNSANPNRQIVTKRYLN